MRQTTTWLEYLRNLSCPANVSVYSLQWAHDVRCIRPGAEHRRVGATAWLHDEWLNAGYASRLGAAPRRVARIFGVHS